MINQYFWKKQNFMKSYNIKMSRAYIYTKEKKI